MNTCVNPHMSYRTPPIIWDYSLTSYREKWPKGVTVNIHTDPQAINSLERAGMYVRAGRYRKKL